MKKIKWFLCELVKTFSNEKSFLSSKRIERAILFWAALVIILNFARLNYITMTASDIVLLTTPLFAYAGFNTVMNNKEKKSLPIEEEGKVINRDLFNESQVN